MVGDTRLSLRFVVLAPFLDERLRWVWDGCRGRGRSVVEGSRRCVTGLAHKTIRWRRWRPRRPSCCAMGFSLQANAKTKEGTAHPDRDAQFQYLNTVVKARL